jgi:hypothetical protein
MNKNILFFIFSIFIFACKTEVKTPTQTDATTTVTKTDDAIAKKTMDEIMVVHDEVMPMMNEIETLQADLKKKLETEKNAVKKSMILAKLTALEKADRAMYAWMDGFKSDFGTMSQTEIDAYLLQQKIDVQAMAQQVKIAIAAAK